MSLRVQVRRGTEANWVNNDPILSQGEIGYATNKNRFKIGDGIRRWSELPYVASGGNGTLTSITVGTGLLGGTITKSGTIAIDKAIVMTTNTPQYITNKTLKSPLEYVVTIDHSGGELALDLSESNDFIINLSGNITNFVFDNLDHISKLFTFRLLIKSTGINIINWPPNCFWPNGTQPILSGTGKLDIITVLTYDNGSTFFGRVEARNITV
jgi:hypothetical protein